MLHQLMRLTLDETDYEGTIINDGLRGEAAAHCSKTEYVHYPREIKDTTTNLRIPDTCRNSKRVPPEWE